MSASTPSPDAIAEAVNAAVRDTVSLGWPSQFSIIEAVREGITAAMPTRAEILDAISDATHDAMRGRRRGSA